MSKKILLLCHDLTTRLNLTSLWVAAGVNMLKPADEEVPDCVVVDLGRRDSLDEIARLRALHPEVTIIACFASYNEEAVVAAREAGADDFAARSFVDRRVARLLKLDA
jgi:DNA-binding response OmpR family regulator